MSRHTIPARRDEVSVVVGWDNPMQTFFAQVTHVTTLEADEDKDPIILWLGGTPDEVPDPESLRVALAPFATLFDDMLRQLHEDRAKCASRPATALQRYNLDLLRGRR